jgi:hydrogenase/urease accessory protein HupE
MMKTLTRGAALVAGPWLVPAALFAHDGHAGHHGWLAGALQPLLSPDHFLAALFVASVLSIGLNVLAHRVRNADSTRNR